MVIKTSYFNKSNEQFGLKKIISTNRPELKGSANQSIINFFTVFAAHSLKTSTCSKAFYLLIGFIGLNSMVFD